MGACDGIGRVGFSLHLKGIFDILKLTLTIYQCAV